MKKWWMWFLFAGLGFLPPLGYYLDGRGVKAHSAYLLLSILFAGLGVCQYVCEKRRKEKLMRYAYAIAIVLTLLYLAFVLFVQ